MRSEQVHRQLGPVWRKASVRNRHNSLAASVRPDNLDGLACAIAYAELLCAQAIPARAWIAGTPDPEARDVADHLGVTLDPSPPLHDCVFVLVDASDFRGMPPLDPMRVVEVIAHRLHHRAAEHSLNKIP